MAIAVPGEVKGFYNAWLKFGRVSWSQLFEATIQLCDEGHIVNSDLSGAIAQYETSIRNDPNLRWGRLVHKSFEAITLFSV